MIKQLRYRRDLWQLFPEPGAVVEIGVAEGNNSEDMLNWKLEAGSPAVTTLYMVDRWMTKPDQAGDASMAKHWHDGNLAKVKKRMKKFGERAQLLRGDSVAMAEHVPDGSLTLLYIDGDHSYEGVIADLNAWLPKVKTGGFVGLHDYLSEAYGVNRAVNEFCKDRFPIYELAEDKPEDAGAYFQVSLC